MKILVTGGAGYIGSHVAKALAAAGFEPVLYDNLSRGHRCLAKWGELEIGDIRDRECLVSVLRRHRPRAVIHLAGVAYVSESFENPALYFDVNVTGSLRLLDAMLETGVRQIVFSSSCTTYGVPQSLPIGECSPQNPVNPYGLSKFMVERALDAYAAAYGLRSAILRYFNACGADPAGETGELHASEPHLIPRTLMAAASELDHIPLLGTDYPTRDGTCVRDYVHVSDLARAHLAAVRYLERGGESVALNLGMGKGFSVREVIQAVERVTGKRVPVRDAPRRPGDPAELVADASSAAAVLGWRPEFTSLDPIVETAWKWYLRSADRAR